MYLTLYLAILFAYLPGTVAVWKWRKLALFPLLVWYYFGMVLFLAIGSYKVMTAPVLIGSLFSHTYVLMLISQVAILYIFAWPYVYYAKTPQKPKRYKRDDFLPWLLMALAICVLGVYYAKIGNFLIFDLLAGKINRLNILDYRLMTYGLPDYPFYRMGFLVLPALAAAAAVLNAGIRGCWRISDATVIVLCAIPPILLAEKAGILNYSAVIFIAYLLSRGFKGESIGISVGLRIITLVAAVFIPTALIYRLYFSLPGDGLGLILNQLVFRIFGVYSEALAATVPFVEKFGFLHGTTVPNIKGLLPFERFNTEIQMHSFLAGGLENRRAGIAGTTPVPANGEGYLNFGVLGFLVFSVITSSTLIVFQELLNRFRLGVVGPLLVAWYGYLAMMLSTTTLFATFLSITHTLLGLFLGMLGVLLSWWASSRGSRE